MSGRTGGSKNNNVRGTTTFEEIGQFTSPWKRSYHPGQFFIHSKLGYRGIVVYAWSPDLVRYVPHPKDALRNPSTPGGDGDAAASSSAMPTAGSAETHLQEKITHLEENIKEAGETVDKAEEKVDKARHTLDTVDSDDKRHSVPTTNGGGESGKAPTEPSLGQFKKLIETVEGSVANLKKPERQDIAMTREQLYYQVLIDERDMSDEQRSVAAVIPNVGSVEEPGAECFAFDYVDHRHMLPYNPSGVAQSGDDDRPVMNFDNSLFNDLFQTVEFNNSSYSVTGSLAIPKSPMTRWNDAAGTRLKYSSVYTTETNGVEVTVIPFLKDRGERNAARGQPKGGEMEADGDGVVAVATPPRYEWTYSVMIENKTDRRIQLISRTWHTVDGDSDALSLSLRQPQQVTDDTIKNGNGEGGSGSTDGESQHLVDTGRGVVKQFPILSRDKAIFLYSSTASLRRSTGSSWGSYTFVEVAEGEQRRRSFQVNVPKFYLNANVGTCEDVVPPFSTGVPTRRSSSGSNPESKTTS